MSVDEAIKQLSFYKRKGAAVVKEVSFNKEKSILTTVPYLYVNIEACYSSCLFNHDPTNIGQGDTQVTD